MEKDLLGKLVHLWQIHDGRPDTLLKASIAYMPAILKLTQETVVFLKILTGILRKKINQISLGNAAYWISFSEIHNTH